MVEDARDHRTPRSGERLSGRAISTTLANDSGDLGLPGWPLLAAILASPEVGRDDAMKVVAAFADIDASNANLAGTHLDRLAALAEENGRKGEAARRTYRHGFNVVAGWPEDARSSGVWWNAGSYRGRELAQRSGGCPRR